MNYMELVLWLIFIYSIKFLKKKIVILKKIIVTFIILHIKLCLGCFVYVPSLGVLFVFLAVS